ncbi:MAG: hypothetical protein K9I84_07825 [Leadbetterella sp.]|nr:hypothetical protein [Leadbetterella sp.]
MKTLFFCLFYFVLYFFILNLIGLIFKILKSIFKQKKILLFTSVKDFILTPWTFASFFLSLLLSLNALFQTSILDHYDIKKGTLDWYLVMDNDFIINFPILYPINKPIYKHIGGDSPNISAGYEVVYDSKLKENQLYPQLENYTKRNGLNLKKVNSIYCNPSGLDSLSKYSIYSAKENGCVEIIFMEMSGKTTKITASIIY